MSPSRARSARDRPAARAPASACRAPSPTSTPDSPCSRPRASFPRPCSRSTLRLYRGLRAGRDVRLRKAPHSHVAAGRRRRFLLTRQVRLRERARSVRIATRLVAGRELRERALALHVTHESLAVLLVHEPVQAARLAHVAGDVGRERQPRLVVCDQLHRELHLLHARNDALGLRDELGLAQPTGRLRRADEPLRVLRTHVAIDALFDRLGAELRDRLARVDTLRAALRAEVAARALPDSVLSAVL